VSCAVVVPVAGGGVWPSWPAVGSDDVGVEVVVEVSCDDAPAPAVVLDGSCGGLVLEDWVADRVDGLAHVEGVSSELGLNIDVCLEPIEESVVVEVCDGGTHAVVVGVDVRFVCCSAV